MLFFQNLRKMLAIYVDFIFAGSYFIPDRLLGSLQTGCFHRMFLKTDLFYDQSIGFFHGFLLFRAKYPAVRDETEQYGQGCSSTISKTAKKARKGTAGPYR